MNKTLILAAGLAAILFVAGCVSIDAPKQMELSVGEPKNLTVPYSSFLKDVKNPKIVSKCSSIEVLSSKPDSSSEIKAEVLLKEYDQQLKSCLSFESSDGSRILGLEITPKRQAHFSYVALKEDILYDKDYDINTEIVIDEKTKKLNLSMNFSTTSPLITIEGKNINEFVYRKEPVTERGTLLPTIPPLRVGDSGDASRKVEINAELFIVEKGTEYKLDSKKITRVAKRKEV